MSAENVERAIRAGVVVGDDRIANAAQSLKIAIESDPNARAYLDQALEPIRDDEDETLGLLTQTNGAPAAIAHLRKSLS